MWRDARFCRLFRFPWRTHQEIDREIDAEVRFHLDMRTQDLVEQGVAPDEARARARREFGRVDVARRSCAEIDRMAERESRSPWAPPSSRHSSAWHSVPSEP